MKKFKKGGSKMKLVAGIAFLLALVLTVSVTANTRGSFLKAAGEDEVGTVTESSDVKIEIEQVEAVAPEEAAPVEEPVVAEEEVAAADVEELPAEEAAAEETPAEGAAAEEASEEPKDGENKPAEGTEEEEEAAETFDVAKAYEYYITLDDQQKAEYLAGLSDENREALLSYIAFMEAQAAAAEETEQAEPEADTPKSVTITIENLSGGSITAGSTVRFNSALSGYDGIDNISYQWMRSLDGSSWEQIPGETSATLTMKADEDNCRYTYKLAVSTSD